MTSKQFNVLSWIITIFVILSIGGMTIGANNTINRFFDMLEDSFLHLQSDIDALRQTVIELQEATTSE